MKFPVISLELDNAAITAALSAYVNAMGVSTEGKNVRINITNKRNGGGSIAQVSISAEPFLESLPSDAITPTTTTQKTVEQVDETPEPVKATKVEDGLFKKESVLESDVVEDEPVIPDEEEVELEKPKSAIKRKALFAAD